MSKRAIPGETDLATMKMRTRIFAATAVAAMMVAAPAAAEELPEEATSVVEEPNTEPAIPETSTPPGGDTSWSTEDGSAPSEAWFQAWEDVNNHDCHTTGGCGNIGLPWQTESGEVETQWTAGDSDTADTYSAPDGSTSNLSKGDYYASGWRATGFDENGRPTGFTRVVQISVDNNPRPSGQVTYTPETGWVVTAPDGSVNAWNWETSETTCVDACLEPGEEAVIEYIPETDGIPDARVPELVTPQVTTTMEGHYQVQVRVADPGTTGTVEVMVRLEPGNWRRLTSDVVDGIATRYLPARYEGLRYTIRNDGEPVARGVLETPTA